MNGVNDITLQALGRWKEPKMIRRYAHLSQEHLADAIEQIGSEVPTGVPHQKLLPRKLLARKWRNWQTH